MKNWLNKVNGFTLTAALTMLPMGSDCVAQTVTPQACEQSIITPAATGRYLWLPIQESTPEGKVLVIVDGRTLTEQNVHMAREQVDYYVALDLQPYQENGYLKVCVQNVPTSSVCFSRMAQNNNADYGLKNEKFRPLYHHTPLRGWMNDPNGMFYKDGVWNLYYQYNPYGSMWGNMHWGHSTTTDLIHWNHEAVALAPDAWGTVFSGSCVLEKDAVVAMYTASRPTPFGGDVQAQCLAYSKDGGLTFEKYEGNPVLTAEDKDFRDPKMFWHEPTGKWIVVLAVGQEVQFYSSKYLKEWKYESSFGREYGNHDGVWECPDMLCFGDKWVLLLNINPGGPFGGSATQYFVGTFDGSKFVCEDNPSETKWMDYGKDHYATVTFHNAPEGRIVALPWMSNWQYANQVPTQQFRSANGLPRDLGIKTIDGETYLTSIPSKEVSALRGKKIKQPSETCEIVIDVKGSADIVLSNTKGEKVSMRYDARKQEFKMDRTKSGDVSFSEAFPCETVAPTYGSIKQLRLFIDRCSIEAFDVDGKMAMTNLVFPSEPYNTIKVKGGKTTIYEIKVKR